MWFLKETKRKHANFNLIFLGMVLAGFGVGAFAEDLQARDQTQSSEMCETPLSKEPEALGVAGDERDGWFTFVSIPDTQNYCKKPELGDIFKSQIEWIVANSKKENIAFAAHVGDIVDNSGSRRQMDFAKTALEPLLNPAATLPFALNRGNHDKVGDYVGSFGSAIYVNRPWKVLVSQNQLNTAAIFQAAGRTFAHIGLNMDPRDEDLDWANETLASQEFAGLPTILTTHDYLKDSGLGENGTIIWNNLVKKKPQIFMVLNGHNHNENRIVSNNDNGKPVYQMLADYQAEKNGGDGYLRLIRVYVTGGKIAVKTFSPGYTINGRKVEPHFKEDDSSQFTYEVDLIKRFE